MSRSILIVDDSAPDRIRLETLLTAAGYEVTSATTGLQAIEAVKRSRPDAILMDVNMPEMDGYAATRALRSDAGTRDIPIVLVTAKGQKADRAWGQMLGAKGHVTKPFTDADLLAQLHAL